MCSSDLGARTSKVFLFATSLRCQFLPAKPKLFRLQTRTKVGIKVPRRGSCFWRGLAVYTAIIVSTLASAEVLSRLYAWEPPRSLEPMSNDGLGLSRYLYSPVGSGDLVPRQDGHWIIWYHRPYHVQTNSLGLRNVEEPRGKIGRAHV